VREREKCNKWGEKVVGTKCPAPYIVIVEKRTASIQFFFSILVEKKLKFPCAFTIRKRMTNV
jgi:hypothetical protein